MNTVSDLYKPSLQLSALADARWNSIVRAVKRRLEVYAFLLCRPGDPFRIEDMLLPEQVVSGGRCKVQARDVVAAGRQAAAQGLVVAGSVHRHPGGGAFLSGTDEDLLQGMACELASAVAVPLQVVRRPRDLTLRVTGSSEVLSENGEKLAPGLYKAVDVEVEETIPGSRVYCLTWGPGNGYFGKVASVLYDPLSGSPQRKFSYLEDIQIEASDGKRLVSFAEVKRAARRLVKEQSYHLSEYSGCSSYASEMDYVPI